MSMPSARLLVFVGENFCCVKIVGRANFNSSVDFKTLLNELRLKGYNYFVLELSECLLMDSTFLGVLTGFGLKMNASDPGSTGRIELLNPNTRIVELLENLGVLHLFQIRNGELAPPNGSSLCEQPSSEPSKEEVTRACLEAHQTLMEANPANVSRFKDVTQFLADDLKRLKPA
ncbi:MAG TPA: STAS domain-containing protein [Verrucomicrobiae bacterium]|nr:STAS domain-containing protein [Verrucomicrobiae bacterium]